MTLFLAFLSQIYRDSHAGGIIMGKEKFGAVMEVLVPQVVHLITENYSYDERIATNEFYGSELYALLEQEDMKLWHFSPLTLFNMFDYEALHTTGTNYIIEDIDLYIEARKPAMA